MSKIIAVADLHGHLPLDIPTCDLLIVAGDICPHFSHKAGSAEDIAGQVRFLEYRFKPWRLNLPLPL